MIGSWNVEIHTNSFPQKIASALGSLSEKIVGAEYEPIAYLGSQIVNGTNHAVLAEQIVTTGRDTKNIVMLTFNEKPNNMEPTLIGIDRLVEGGVGFGGAQIDVHTDIPADFMTKWNEAFEGFVGAGVEPFALLGTQVTNGENLIFAATSIPVAPNAQKKVVIVTINTSTKRVCIADVLNSKQTNSLGYAFNW